MRTYSGSQIPWVRLVGLLLAIVMAIAVVRGAWEIVVLAGLVTVLVAAYLLRNRMRRRLLYDRNAHRPPVP
jgi:uncharacterized membrane protein